MNTKSGKTVLGDGSYESPIETDFIFKDDQGNFRINKSGFSWNGPPIDMPVNDKVILMGNSNGTTIWKNYLDLFPKNYGIVGVNDE